MRFQFLYCFLISVLFASPARASESDVINRDVYMTSDVVEVSEWVNGNVYLLGSDVTISGHVTGNVYLIGGQVSITGEVEGDVRGGGAQMILDGVVHGSISCFCGSFESSSKTKCLGKLLVFAGSAYVDGDFEGPVSLYASSVKTYGHFKQGASVHAEELLVGKGTQITGELHYWSSSRPNVQSPALQDQIKLHDSFLSHIQSRWFNAIRVSSRLIALVMNFLYCFVIGLLMMRFYRAKIDAGVRAIQKFPVMTFVNGVIIMVCLPLAALLLLVTIVGLPFALTLIAIGLIGFYAAKVLVVIWFSRRIRLLKSRPKLKFFISLILYFLLTAAPYIGLIISIFVTIYGIGAIVTRNRNDLVFVERR